MHAISICLLCATSRHTHAPFRSLAQNLHSFIIFSTFFLSLSFSLRVSFVDLFSVFKMMVLENRFFCNILFCSVVAESTKCQPQFTKTFYIFLSPNGFFLAFLKCSGVTQLIKNGAIGVDALCRFWGTTNWLLVGFFFLCSRSFYLSLMRYALPLMLMPWLYFPQPRAANAFFNSIGGHAYSYSCMELTKNIRMWNEKWKRSAVKNVKSAVIRTE